MVEYGVKSDKGFVRSINEDYCSVISGYTGAPGIFIVADGMGGHNSGEVASKMAVEFIADYMMKHPDILSDAEDECVIIRSIMEKANNAVYAKSKEQEEMQGMGTTLIMAAVSNSTLFIGHIGDSRAYLVREDRIERITTDHSFIEELIKNGSLTREEAEGHPKRNIITRALGCTDIIDVDTYKCKLAENDKILLCTDGLTNMLAEDEILEIVKKHDDPQLACDMLVHRANEKGGEDNITVIVVRN